MLGRMPLSSFWTTSSLSTCADGRLPVLLPQLPKLLELVGLGYSAWFTYRYLLFKVQPVSRRVMYMLAIVARTCALLHGCLGRCMPLHSTA